MKFQIWMGEAMNPNAKYEVVSTCRSQEGADRKLKQLREKYQGTRWGFFAQPA
jgi:hypothetical protein